MSERSGDKRDELVAKLQLAARDSATILADSLRSVLLDAAEALHVAPSHVATPEPILDHWAYQVEMPRRDGHSALRARDGKLERFDPHPESAPSSTAPHPHPNGTPVDGRIYKAANPKDAKESLRSIKDFGGHDGYGRDEWLCRIAQTIDDLEIALASQIEITNTERSAKERLLASSATATLETMPQGELLALRHSVEMELVARGTTDGGTDNKEKP